jgi:hypothetical protein
VQAIAIKPNPAELALAASRQIEWQIATGRRNGAKNASFKIRKGEVGCLFDEIGNLVEPTERPHKDVRTGPQRRQDAGASRSESRL